MYKVVWPVQYVNIEEELKRNPKLKMSDLQILKDWMDKQFHLPKIEMLYLIMFLHSNYYYLEPTKQTIDNFFTARTHMPEIFSNRDPIAWKVLRKAFKTVACIPLKDKTKENYIITLGKLLDIDPRQYDADECSKYFLMTCEIQNIMEGTTEGHVVIFDAAGFSFSHLARMNFMNMRKILFYIQEAVPVRLKGLHILNTMPVVYKIFNMLKPFVKKELLKLVHFHMDLNTVKEFLPIEVLPNEYGGKAGVISELIEEHIKVLEEFRDWFQYDEYIGRVNESLRVGKCQMTDDLFGIDGSFKKLEID